MPDVGVTGGIGAPVPASESPSPTRSIERERMRTFKGVMGDGAEIAFDAIGAYIDCGRTRLLDALPFPLGEDDGEVASEGGASPLPKCRPAVFPIVSSPPPDVSSESS